MIISQAFLITNNKWSNYPIRLWLLNFVESIMWGTQAFYKKPCNYIIYAKEIHVFLLSLTYAIWITHQRNALSRIISNY